MFCADDGFGVAVARRLQRETFPDGVAIMDFGVRAMQLAFELLATPVDLLVIVDAAARGGEPGTIYVIDPERDPDVLRTFAADAHAMSPFAVLAMLRAMGTTLPGKTRIIGCEPDRIAEGGGLSDAAMQAIAPATSLVRRLIADTLAQAAARSLL